MSFAAITLCVDQRVFIAVSVYFFIDSVRKLLDTPSYNPPIKVFLTQVFFSCEVSLLKCGVYF